MVGHLIALIIDAQQVIHAIRCQFLNDGIGLLTDRDVHHLRHGSVVVHTDIIGTGGAHFRAMVDSLLTDPSRLPAASPGSTIGSQPKEGQGRPDDENGRHWGSQLFGRFAV